MNITFACPKCAQPARLEVSESDRTLSCPHCGVALRVPETAFQAGHLCRCLVCPSADLFVRKDFPQRLGVAIVLAGIVGSSIAWAGMNIMWTFGILFATALADVVLYFLVGDALMCYRCGAQYRGLSGTDQHGPFELTTHERYRQLRK